MICLLGRKKQTHTQPPPPPDLVNRRPTPGPKGYEITNSLPLFPFPFLASASSTPLVASLPGAPLPCFFILKCAHIAPGCQIMALGGARTVHLSRARRLCSSELRARRQGSGERLQKCLWAAFTAAALHLQSFLDPHPAKIQPACQKVTPKFPSAKDRESERGWPGHRR